jgi:hypothetical protein
LSYENPAFISRIITGDESWITVKISVGHRRESQVILDIIKENDSLGHLKHGKTVGSLYTFQGDYFEGGDIQNLVS